MNDRPTPETDAACGYALTSHYGPSKGSYLQMDRMGPFVHTEVARRLERERDEARDRAERYRLEANAMMMQRDEAREALKYIAHSGLSARFLEDYAREFLKSRGGAK